MDEIVAANIVAALVAIGMGVAFFLADRSAPTSRALALFLAALGVAIIAYSLTPDDSAWSRWLPMLETLAFVAGFEWGLRVSRTVPDLTSGRASGEAMVRVAQGLVLVYCLAAVLLPDLHAQKFQGGKKGGADPADPAFYVFAGPLLLAVLFMVLSTAMLMRQRPDPAERVRIYALLLATPFLAGGLVLPNQWVAISIGVGEVIFLVGAIQYHVIQGARGQFLSRFFSPQVAQLVRERGLGNTMQTDRLLLSVVSCDIRGFTAYARAVSPERVIQILREYYREVGEVVAGFGATIKDQAGDGILILVGAPIAYADHAERALTIARNIRERVRPVLARHSTTELQLGLGIGVASGEVAVGVIGEASRLEYTAVGSAVNLAARLCSEASDGEIRVDSETMSLAGNARARAVAPLALKGFDQPVVNFVV